LLITIPLRCDHRQESFSVAEPDAGVVIWKLGSDDQVTAPLFLRMYLYWTAVFAGRLTVSAQNRMRRQLSEEGREYTYSSRPGSLPSS
jgi:hypothetical protein